MSNQTNNPKATVDGPQSVDHLRRVLLLLRDHVERTGLGDDMDTRLVRAADRALGNPVDEVCRQCGGAIFNFRELGWQHIEDHTEGDSVIRDVAQDLACCLHPEPDLDCDTPIGSIVPAAMVRQEATLQPHTVKESSACPVCKLPIGNDDDLDTILMPDARESCRGHAVCVQRVSDAVTRHRDDPRAFIQAVGNLRRKGGE
jgi:hypothetical protein